MVSDKFRQDLPPEVEKCHAEGLMDESEYPQVTEGYELDCSVNRAGNCSGKTGAAAVKQQAVPQAIAILIGAGVIFLAIAAIAILAALWPSCSRELKVMLLLSLFVALNAAGFSLWRQTSPASGSQWQKELGKRLLVLSALVLGASLVLVRLLFHVNGSAAELLASWGLGVLAMSYSLRLARTGGLAIVLIGLGYWLAWFELGSGQFSWLQALVQHAPLFAALLFVPLAYWCRSRPVFVLAAIALCGSLEVNLWAAFAAARVPLHWTAAIAIALPPALLWSYDDCLYLGRSSESPRPSPKLFYPSFRRDARALALVFLAIAFYILSFHGFWADDAQVLSLSEATDPTELQEGLLYLFDVLLIAGGWVALFWRRRAEGSDANRTSNVLACLIAVAALAQFWHLGISPIGAIATLIFNGLLFLLAAGLIRAAAAGRSRAFWFGLGLLVLQLLSRLLEYGGDLFAIAVALLLCGAAFLAAGLCLQVCAGSFAGRSHRTATAARSLPGSSAVKAIALLLFGRPEKANVERQE